MKRILVSSALICALATSAFAGADEDITTRQAAMKAIGAAAKAGDFTAMAEAAVAAQTAFKVDTTGQGTLKTTAAPNVWTDMAGFSLIMDQLVARSAAGDKSVFETCKACHADYRVK